MYTYLLYFSQNDYVLDFQADANTDFATGCLRVIRPKEKL
jgi:hypothetical protein